MSNFYNNFVKLCAKRGYSPSGAARAIGLSNATANGWKMGKTPSDVNLMKLSQLLSCSVSDLTDGEETEKNGLLFSEWKHLSVALCSFIRGRGGVPSSYAGRVGVDGDRFDEFEKTGLSLEPAEVLAICQAINAPPEMIIGREYAFRLMAAAKEKTPPPPGAAGETERERNIALLIDKLMSLSDLNFEKVSAYVDGLTSAEGR